MFISSQYSFTFISCCQTVQFDDTIRPELAGHSGVYKLAEGKTNSRKGFTYEEVRKGGDHRGFISYCSDRERWVFHRDDTSACHDFLVESTKTQSYDLLSSFEDTWFVRLQDSSQSVAMDDFYLTGICIEDIDCGGSERGTCTSNHVCNCKSGYEGIRCVRVVDDTCSTLRLDERFSSAFPSTRPGLLPSM